MALTQDESRALVAERIDQLLAACPPESTGEMDFWGSQFDLGLAWVHFPEGRGGLGVSPGHQLEVDRRLRAAGAPTGNRLQNIIGIGMAAATILEHGTDGLQERLLRPIFTTEEIWCQLFSEPGAGSDLAALSTRAVPDGDTWVVNGQKVWTTLAHVARWGLLLARTDPDAAKHAGLTYFVCPMDIDGVEVRPLYQITGEAEFNEVFLRDVHIPDDLRLGEVGSGWSVAMTTLMNERVAIGGTVPERGAGSIALALEAWEARAEHDPAHRDRLTQLWIEAEALRLTAIRAAEGRAQGTPGPEGSTTKLHWAELNKTITSFALDLLGAEGLLYPEGYEPRRPEHAALEGDTPHSAFLRARANSIEGGTSEIMKTVLGERVLGLPPEPRVDKDVPWRDVPR